MKAVTAIDLTKTFSQGKKAVDRLSLDLEPGEIFGFLGPNGAGKTTTVKLLSGMLSPTEGSCKVFGADPSGNPEAVHKISGVLTEHAQMYDHMTGLENLMFYGAVFDLDNGKCRKLAFELLERLELTEAKDRKLAAYSTGMRQRLSLARAMIHQPKILFLDEPTSGLDPESALNVNSIIKDLAEHAGATIFLCTHQLRYAQEICSSYGLIDDGRLFAAGGLKKLRSLVYAGMTTRITTDYFPEKIPHTDLGNGTFEFKAADENEIPPIVRAIVEHGGNICHVSSRRLSLEEIYFSLLEKRKQKKEADYE